MFFCEICRRRHTRRRTFLTGAHCPASMSSEVFVTMFYSIKLGPYSSQSPRPVPLLTFIVDTAVAQRHASTKPPASDSVRQPPGAIHELGSIEWLRSATSETLSAYDVTGRHGHTLPQASRAPAEDNWKCREQEYDGV
jgi:hypothetical protein